MVITLNGASRLYPYYNLMAASSDFLIKFILHEEITEWEVGRIWL